MLKKVNKIKKFFKEKNTIIPFFLKVLKILKHYLIITVFFIFPSNILILKRNLVLA